MSNVTFVDSAFITLFTSFDINLVFSIFISELLFTFITFPALLSTISTSDIVDLFMFVMLKIELLLLKLYSVMLTLAMLIVFSTPSFAMLNKLLFVSTLVVTGTYTVFIVLNTAFLFAVKFITLSAFTSIVPHPARTSALVLLNTSFPASASISTLLFKQLVMYTL